MVQDNLSRGAAIANAHHAIGCGGFVPAPLVKKLDVSAVGRAKEEAGEDPSGLVNHVWIARAEDSTSVLILVPTALPGRTHDALNVEERGRSLLLVRPAMRAAALSC